MSTLKVPTGLVIAAGVVVLLFLYIIGEKDEEIKVLKKQVADNEGLNEKVRQMLRHLIDQTKNTDPNIAQELASIIALINIKQEPVALMKLAKVIESLLAELYEKDERVKEIAKAAGRKKPVFADHLELARERKLIDQEGFHMISVLKSIRNEEAHKPNVRKEVAKMIGAMIAGITFVYALCRLLQRTTIDTRAT